jgi:hypothetical protein
MFVKRVLKGVGGLLSVQLGGLVAVKSGLEVSAYWLIMEGGMAGKRRTGFVVDYLSGYHKIAARCIFLLFDGGDYLHVFMTLLRVLTCLLSEQGLVFYTVIFKG